MTRAEFKIQTGTDKGIAEIISEGPSIGNDLGKLNAEIDYKAKLQEQENKIRGIHEDTDKLKNKLRESYYNASSRLDRINSRQRSEGRSSKGF